MKNLTLLFIFLMSAIITTAQVPSTRSKGKDVFKSFPAMKHAKSKIISEKKMPKIDTEKLLKETW